MRSSIVADQDVVKAEFKLDIPIWQVSDIGREMDRLRKNVQKAHDIPLIDTVALLDTCARKWLNREYSGKTVEVLSKIVNQTPRLVLIELEECMKMLLRENIEKSIKSELGNPDILDGWVNAYYGKVRREPRGIVFHNISGNAFIVVPTSISLGLLSKNCNFVKVSKDEPYFAYAFYQSLKEIDKSITDRLSVGYFDSTNPESYRTAISLSDCAVHWGGLESTKMIQKICMDHQVKLISHGPKVSFEVVDSFESDSSKIAENVAADMLAWEQKACLSPRILFINRNLDYRSFTKQLANALKSFSKVYPKTYMTEWNSIKSIQDRQYCIEKYGLANGVEVYSSYNADYTVLLTSDMPEKDDIDRCFYRFIFVCPYDKPQNVIDWIKANIQPYLQTMGYTGNNMELIDQMAELGVTAITKSGNMSRHAPGSFHDGMSDLEEMTYAVSYQFQ